jgi:hypothetical protein
MERLAVLFRLRRTSRHSFLALEAGMEISGSRSRVSVFHGTQRGVIDLFPLLDAMLRSHRTVLVAYSIMTAALESVRAEMRCFVDHAERSRLGLVADGPPMRRERQDPVLP